MATVKPRQTGATAVIAPTGQPVVTSATGGEITLNRAATDPAFSPLDLLYAAIAGCLAVGIRDAARRTGVLDRLRSARVEVKGDKATDGPQRVVRLKIKFEIDGDFDEATRAALIAEAEETCTVSNTIRATPEFVTMGDDDAAAGFLPAKRAERGTAEGGGGGPSRLFACRVSSVGSIGCAPSTMLRMVPLPASRGRNPAPRRAPACAQPLPPHHLDDLSLPHRRGAVAHVGDDVHVVADQDEGHAARGLEIVEEVEDLGLHRHVEGRGRLVEEEEARAEEERAGDGDPLALSAGERVRVAAGELGRQADGGEGFRGSGARVGQAVDAERLLEGAADACGGDGARRKGPETPSGRRGGGRR